MSVPSKRELEVMRHSLGADSRSPGFRNYYCASDGDELLEGMVSKGYLKRGGTINGGRDRHYFVTDEWRNVLIRVLS